MSLAPPTGRITVWDEIIVLWRALRQRACALTGLLRFPRSNTVWAAGTISAATETTITDDAADWSALPSGCTGKLWGPRDCPDANYTPIYYDVVLNAGEFEDERRILHVHIDDNDTDTLTFPTIVDLVTAGLIPSVDWLEGTRYEIIKRSGYHWSDRWPEWPNDREAHKGTVYAGTDEGFIDATAGWAAGTVVVVTLGGSGLGGTFTIGVSGKSTAAIAYNAAHGTVASALLTLDPLALPANGAADRVAVTGSAGGPWTLTFSPLLGDVAVTADGAGLTGATPTAGVSYTHHGPTGGPTIAVSPVDGTLGRVPPDDALAGLECLVYGSDGRLHRVTVAGNKGNVVRFDALASGWTPSGLYSVVQPDGRALPGRRPAGITCWYRGSLQPYWSHLPTDLVLGDFGQTFLPKTSEDYSTGEIADDCNPATAALFDVDFWSSLTEACSAADRSFNPDLFKTIRGLQIAVEQMLGSFVERPVGLVEQIPNYTLPRLFYKAAINAGKTTTTTVDGDGDFTFTVTGGAGTIYYTLADSTGGTLDDASAEADGSSVVSLSGGTTGKSYTVYWTRGWTRWLPKRFRYVYPAKGFIPDISELSPGEAILPPAVEDFDESGCLGVGRWESRAASTGWLRYLPMGIATEPDGTFQAGDVGRYVGDNFNDPGISPADQVSISEDRPEGFAPETPYYHHLTQTRQPRDAQREYEAGKVGTATAGGQWFLADDTKDWYDGAYGTGTLRTESATATGGSTTTLVDSVAVSDDERACFWDTSTGRWAGFVLRVIQDDVEIRVPITASTTNTLTFPLHCGLTVASGDNYSIVEPRWLVSRWQGRTLIITKDDGTKLTRIITHSDDTHLFFSPLDEPVLSGWTYKIVELEIGGTYEWTGSAWVKPVTPDTRGQAWKADVFKNEPQITRRYGRYTKGDVYAPAVEELRTVINLLISTKLAAGWTNKAGEFASAESNGQGGGSGGCPASYAYINDTRPDRETSVAAAQSAADSAFGSATPSPNAGAPPSKYASITGEENYDPDGNLVVGGNEFEGTSGAGMSATYAYARVVDIPTCLSCTCYFYGKGSMEPGGDPDDPPQRSGISVVGIDAIRRDYDAPSPFDDEGFFNLFSTVSGSDAIRYSSQVGDLSAPTAAVDFPPQFDADYATDATNLFRCNSVRGYFISELVCVLTWDFDPV